METHRKTVRIPLDLTGAEEHRLTEVLIDMGYDWGLKFYKNSETKEAWVEMQLPDDVHF